MARCPKCEEPQPETAAVCAHCGTPLCVATATPGRRREGAPILDPLLDHFDRREVVAFCPDCQSEYREGSRCRHCGGIALRRIERKEYTALLQSWPLMELGARVSAGPPSVPRDLQRVLIAESLQEALQWRKEFSFMGIAVTLGSDSLDPFSDPGCIGVYVRAHDLAAARYLLEGHTVTDPLDVPPCEEETLAVRHLDEARDWLALRKYREVERLVRKHLDEDPAGGVLLFEALLLSGKKRSAEAEALARAARPGLDTRERALLRMRAAQARALGYEGHPFAEGSDVAGAKRLLLEVVGEAPRLLDAGKTLAEILQYRGERSELLRLLGAMDRVNPNLLAHDGPYRSLRAQLTV